MDLHFLRLWDIYNPILTEHQREITDLYFNCDLSLAEIAEQKGCSRQSVSDTLNKARRQMEECEEKLRFSRLLAESALAQSLMAENINRWARENLSEEACAHILSLTQRDYSEEAKKRAEENSEKQG